jgi:predicted enzyme related to lactoylglutathione lyase
VNFAYTRLITDDLERLATFYEKLLGIPPKGSGEYVEFHPGGAVLAILSRKGARYAYGREWPTGPAAAILEFSVDDVDAERERIDGFVNDWLQQPEDMPWGNRSMMFRDPDGNAINFFKPPTRP